MTTACLNGIVPIRRQWLIKNRYQGSVKGFNMRVLAGSRCIFEREFLVLRERQIRNHMTLAQSETTSRLGFFILDDQNTGVWAFRGWQGEGRRILMVVRKKPRHIHDVDIFASGTLYFLCVLYGL